MTSSPTSLHFSGDDGGDSSRMSRGGAAVLARDTTRLIRDGDRYRHRPRSVLDSPEGGPRARPRLREENELSGSRRRLLRPRASGSGEERGRG